MNPFMMMFGPLGGFGFFGGGCGCGVNMPYYGMDDRLTFMNFPVFRNTSMDYLLDPRLAMMQSQQSWMNGGNIFGNTMLPMFNNFPGMNFPGMNTPWNIWGPQRTETEDEKKKREAKEAEDKKPEVIAQKAKVEKYKEAFETFKANVDTEDSEFKELKAQFDNALRESKPEDQLKKLEEVFKQLEPETLRKIALADKDINSQLFMIGYNYPETSSFKHNITSPEVDWTVELKNFNFADNTSVGRFGAMMKDLSGKQVLQILSTWNDTNKKGILETLAEHLPDDSKQFQWQTAVVNLTDALTLRALTFANEYGGMSKFEKLNSQVSKVEELLKPIKSIDLTSEDLNSSSSKKITKTQITNLAKEFNNLYAMLRVLEAEALNKKVVNKYAEQFNGIVSGAIPEDIIVKETTEDLKSESIDVPTDVDEIPEKTRGFKINRSAQNTDMTKIDEETKGDAEKRAEKLVEKEKLEKVDDDLYRTLNDDANAPKKYYAVTEDNKLIEVKYNDTTKECEALSENDTTAVEIDQYIKTVNAIDEYISSRKIVPSEYTEGAYLSADKHPDGHSDAFLIKDNKLVKIKGSLLTNGNVKLNTGVIKTIDELTPEDYSEVKSKDDIYTKPAEPAGNDETGAEEKTDNNEADSKTEIKKIKIDTESDAYKKGDYVAKKIDGSTKKRDHIKINNTLEEIDDTNVLNFLAGFYSHDFHEGIIEWLDDEWDGGRIKMENKKKLINSLISYAEAHGISSNDETIEEIKSLLSMYDKDDEYEDSQTFNHNDAWLGWIDTSNSFWDGVTAFFGDSKTHNEMIDEAMEELYERLVK